MAETSQARWLAAAASMRDPAKRRRIEWTTRFASWPQSYQPLAVEILREAIRIPADYVDRARRTGGDPLCGLSNHEGPRLEYLRGKIVEIGAVDGPEDVGFDDFGNLVWTVEDPDDGVPPDEKTVIYFDGHTDTVQALRPRWHEAIGGGIDAYLTVDRPDARGRPGASCAESSATCRPTTSGSHLVWGRGSADQLGGVVCQIIATKILRELRAEGALRGVDRAQLRHRRRGGQRRRRPDVLDARRAARSAGRAGSPTS